MKDNVVGKAVSGFSRRDFLKTSAAASVATMAVSPTGIFAAGSDELKLGIIGCGGRGTGAVTQALLGPKTSVKLWAMGDLLGDQLEDCYNNLAKGSKGRYDRDDLGPLTHKMDVPQSRKFVGFDAYQKVIDSEIDMVILTCPPQYRPKHLEAAVKAGKHVFMEKPAAVDPVGIRRIIAASEEARKKGLSIVAGTQRRHQKHYIDIMNRVHDGQIGEVRAVQVYWVANYGAQLSRPKPAGMSDMEWQTRNWYIFSWLCGDHIVEQHTHNLDIMNWAMKDETPNSCMGMGGRAVRVGGDIWDHFAVEFEYANGIRAMSMCRQIPGTTLRVSEHIVGTKGTAYLDSSMGYIEGEKPYKPGGSPNPYYTEHIDLVDSILNSKKVNEGVQLANSTMCAIMGRMSSYTGRALKWDWAMKASKLELKPPKYDMINFPDWPIAVPGKTPLI